MKVRTINGCQRASNDEPIRSFCTGMFPEKATVLTFILFLLPGILSTGPVCTGPGTPNETRSPVLPSDSSGNESRPNVSHLPLRILTWNISLREFLREDRAREVRRVILESKADVIAFQEMTPEFYRLLSSDAKFSENYRLVPGNPAHVKGRLVLATRLNVVESRYIRLPGRMGRYAQKAVFQLEGGQDEADSGSSKTPGDIAIRFSIMNLHLESYLEDGAIRASQIRRIAPFIQAPALVLGDFNFGDGPEANLERQAIPEGYRDLWKERYKVDPGLTWNQEENPLSLMFKFDGEKSRRLDYILLFEESWRLHEIQMLGRRKVLEYRGKPIPPSDHYAVMADLIVPRSNPVSKEEPDKQSTSD